MRPTKVPQTTATSTKIDKIHILKAFQQQPQDQPHT
jgi:hypothetical protein